ncbi:hypothetical protein [Micromonospora sediminicola]|uniref:hypothetical protein n=1 Tax=Micromonospora sediminicola TaxID=946078 RepID=UPI0037883CFB
MTDLKWLLVAVVAVCAGAALLRGWRAVGRWHDRQEEQQRLAAGMKASVEDEFAPTLAAARAFADGVVSGPAWLSGDGAQLSAWQAAGPGMPGVPGPGELGGLFDDVSGRHAAPGEASRTDGYRPGHGYPSAAWPVVDVRREPVEVTR